MEAGKEPIKVTIVDDSKSYRESLKGILNYDERMKLYSEYDSGSAFMASLDSNFQPDVCLIDVVLKDKSGLDCARMVKEKGLDMHMVIMTAYPDAESFSEARKVGADYVEKGPRFEAFLDQIISSCCVSSNEKFISLKSDSKLKIGHIDLINELDAVEKRAHDLSENQITVLKLKKSGKSISEIARIMDIEPATVHTHLKRAMKKLRLPDPLDYIFD